MLWNSSPKKPTGSVFMMPLGQKDFVQTPSKAPFNYHFGYGCFWAILFLAKHALNTKNDSIEEGDVDNCLGKKKILPPLWNMPNQVQVLLLPATFESNGMMSHTCKLSLAAKMVIKWWPLKLLLSSKFIQDSSSEAETLVHGKAKCLLAIGKDSPSQWQKVITNASFNYCTCIPKKTTKVQVWYFYPSIFTERKHIMYHW